MKKWNIGEGLRMPSERELPFLLLMIVGVMEFLFITLESLFSYIGYYLVEDYIIVPCLLFVGIAMTRKLTPFAKRRLLLAAVAAAWFSVVQLVHKVSGMGTHPIGTVFFVYLMMFPFAAVTEDRENLGLKIMGKVLAAASLVLVLDTILLVLDCVPGILEPFVYWDGARLTVFWHPNIVACLLMVGIGFCIAFFFGTDRVWKKILLAVAVVLQFVAMALTNCRTTLLMTCAFLGGIVFFLLYKGGWKRIVLGLVAALVVMAVSFQITSVIFELHNDRLEADIVEQLQEVENPEELDQNFVVDEETGEIQIVAANGQGSLSSDLKTLNGRTGIWKAVLCAIRDNKSIALWGTEYVGLAISPYNAFDVVHAHNSWMEVLMRLGIPGLLTALVFTWIAVRSAWVLVWNRNVEIWKKVIAMMTMCVMVAGFLEPYLFITNVYYHVIDFVFFFCTGYLDIWWKQLRDENM